jgi:L-aminopeptidase/D-esterase-like protein
MRHAVIGLGLSLLAPLLPAGSCATPAEQAAAQPVLNSGEHTLEFDWPAIRVGTGEYEEGPTGVTVLYFPHRVLAVVDVRGGAPGTVNTDILRLGYEDADIDAVVFSGGSAYGLESITAVGTALKDDALRSGAFDDVALSVGAIIYDLGDRRLNELYPDKRLAQAAFRAARPGVFPLGAHGAGRFAKTGYYVGCNAYSGQGAAFRQVGTLKVAAFVVVNAVGVVTTRDGRVAACYRGAGWPADLKTADLLALTPVSRLGDWTAASGGGRRNTTISLIVTNRKLRAAELQRLAVQVHASMGRAVQPFATQYDGDVLYAASTAEADAPSDQSGMNAVDLDVVAAEVMWDAILASVPEQPPVLLPDDTVHLPGAQLRQYAGEYAFSPLARLRITEAGGELHAVASGARSVYLIGRDAPVVLRPRSATDFVVPGRYPMLLRFAPRGVLVLNPGHWQQTGRRSVP